METLGEHKHSKCNDGEETREGQLHVVRDCEWTVEKGAREIVARV